MRLLTVLASRAIVSLPDGTYRAPLAGSAIPRLHDSLACNFSALEFDRRGAEHLGSIGIRAALRESESVAYGNTVFDLVEVMLRPQTSSK